MLTTFDTSGWQAGGVADFDDLRALVRGFVDEREWGQFHDPKSLILALVGEVGELAELYQWLPAGETAQLACEEPLGRRSSEELADILIYLIGLADVLHIDLVDAATRKLDAARLRFPVDQHRGIAPTRY